MIKARRYCLRERTGKCGDEYCSRDPGGAVCVFEYDEAKCDPEHLYTGPDWPPPRAWLADDGVIVYRTYADYLD